MSITSGSHAKLLWPGLNKIYTSAESEYSDEWSDIFTVETSTKAFEEDIGVTGFGLFSTKPEGNAIFYDNQSQGYLTRYNHVEYALGFIITEIMLEDDQYDSQAKRWTKGLAFSGRQTKETVCANVLNRAFNTTYTGGDSATLIASAGGGGSSSHPNVSGGTWTNGPSTAADPSEAAIEQACIDISRFTDDRGKKIKVLPDCIITSPDQEFEFERILASTLRVATADNDTNALRSLSKIPGGVKVNHYLTDTDAWFIKTNMPDGFKLFERRAMRFRTDDDFDTSNAKFKADCRFSVGWTDPRCVWGSPGA